METPSSIAVRQDGEVVSQIVMGPGVLAAPDAERNLLGEELGSRRIAIFAQPGSAEIARRLGGVLRAPIRLLPDREAAKRLSVAEEAYSWLNELGFTRRDVVIAVGGGALTDAAGFIAATYLRGVPIVLVPTTLLGAVDAAIGGKTGVNVEGKNLVGVFRHPHRVVIDTEVIAALPTELLREGAAEAVKAGLIGDPQLVALYEQHGLAAPVAQVVARAVHVKVGVVSADFREAGKRAFLNYGHTLGHAIEVAAGISHGEAVAVGMVAAGAVAETRLGFADVERQRAVIAQLGLPTVSPPVDPDRVRQLVALDKKRDSGGLRMVLLRAVGSPELVAVADDDVDQALRAVGITAT